MKCSLIVTPQIDIYYIAISMEKMTLDCLDQDQTARYVQSDIDLQSLQKCPRRARWSMD